ncbi:MAG: mechanosensitive ion channel domain-containing protein [Bacteroidota bacterium]
MENLVFDYKTQVLASVITVSLLLILRYVIEKTIRKIGKIGDFNRARTVLIIKYISIGLFVLGVVALTLIWGVNIKDLGLIFSSIFAVIGVTLFAQWSIISNVTAGIILFFSFPYKIGDRIKIMDKDISDTENEYEVFLIEDIKAYHIYLRKSIGELLTYPNNLMLQKAVSLMDQSKGTDQDGQTI